MDNRVDRKSHVRSVVDDCRGIACAHADSGFAARIRGFDHTRTARSENDVSLFHNEVGHFEARRIDPIDDAFGSACGNSGVKHDLCSGDSGFFRSGVRADDDAVSRLERNERLENSGRRGVSGRNNRGDETDRLCDFNRAVSLILFDDTAGFGVLVCIVDILRGVVVFDDLILDDTHTRFFNREFCKRYSHLVCRNCRGEEDFVHLLLRKGCKFSLSLTNARNGFFESFHTVDNVSCFHACFSYIGYTNFWVIFRFSHRILSKYSREFRFDNYLSI